MSRYKSAELLSGKEKRETTEKVLQFVHAGGGSRLTWKREPGETIIKPFYEVERRRWIEDLFFSV